MNRELIRKVAYFMYQNFNDAETDEFILNMRQDPQKVGQEIYLCYLIWVGEEMEMK